MCHRCEAADDRPEREVGADEAQVTVVEIGDYTGEPVRASSAPAPPRADPYDWRPTYADLHAQVRDLHRQVGELHLATARAMEARIHAGLREDAARHAQVEAEAAVERARALLDRYRAACLCARPAEFGHADDCLALTVPSHALRTVLDGAEANADAG